MAAFQPFLVGFVLNFFFLSSLGFSDSDASVDQFLTGLEFGEAFFKNRFIDPINHYKTNSAPKVARVRNTLQSLSSLYQYNQTISQSITEENNSSLILREVVDDACIWLNSVLSNDESFECTENEVNYLLSRMNIYTSLNNGVELIKYLCGDECIGYVNNDPDYAGWIIENIPCEGDGMITRNYLSGLSATNGLLSTVNFASLHCPTPSLSS